MSSLWIKTCLCLSVNGQGGNLPKPIKDPLEDAVALGAVSNCHSWESARTPLPVPLPQRFSLQFLGWLFL